MTKNISSRDWESLSAYLDGYISQKERQQLEERLQRSVELRNGLEELRRTRRVLRSQPKMRASRNFTLTADMVGAKAAGGSVPRMFPVLRLASVLASILLVLVVVGDLLTAPGVQTAQLDTANRAVEMAAPAATESGEVEMPAEAPQAQAYSEKSAEPDETPPSGMMMMAAPTEAPQATQAEALSAPALPSGGGGSPPGDQATDTAAMVAPSETPPPVVEMAPAQSDEAAVQSQPSSRTYWRTAEIILALLAISSGLVAIYLHRSSTG